MKLGSESRLTPSACPACGFEADAASQAVQDDEPGTAVPKPGDLSLCVHCGVALQFGDALQLHILTDDEREELPLAIRVQLAEAQRIVMLAKRLR